MKTWEDRIMFAFYGLFGAAIGFLIFAVALGGWRFLLTQDPAEPWNGLTALILCTALGAGWGLFAYQFKDREYGSGPSSLFQDQATAILLVKRLMVLATCLAGVYFVWQLARTL